MTVSSSREADRGQVGGETAAVRGMPLSGRTKLLTSSLIVALCFSLLTHGAVDHASSSALTVVLGVISLFSLSVRGGSRNVRRLLAALGFITLSLAMYVVFQALRLPAEFLDHPAWQIVRGQLGPVSGAVSVAPGQTLAALVGLAPILGGLIVLRIASDQADALAVLRALLVTGYAVAAIGLVQHFWFPRSVLFSTKSAYLGNLTAVFVNRNSAGTFLGVTAVASMGLSLFFLRQIDFRRFHRSAQGDGGGAAQPEHLQFAMYSAGTVLTLIALFLTQSRGAILATLVGAIVLVSILSAWRFTKSRYTGQPSIIYRIRPWIMLSAVFLVFFMFGGKVQQRFEDEGADTGRICVYTSALQATIDNWPLGAGFGTFQQVFPAYRDAQCPGINGVWEAAHNSYLEAAMGIGIVFPLVLLLVLGVLIAAYVRGFRERRRFRFAPATGMSVLVLVLLHSALDFSLQIPGIALYVSMLLACCAVIAVGRTPTASKVPLEPGR